MMYRSSDSEAHDRSSYPVSYTHLYSLICSGVSVLLFDFLFTSPHFSFTVGDAQYFATFPVMLLSAFLTSSLALRIKRQARQSAETAYRTKILFDTDRMLQSEKDPDGIVSVTCRQLTKLLEKDVIWYRAEDGGLGLPQVFAAAGGGAGSQAVSYTHLDGASRLKARYRFLDDDLIVVQKGFCNSRTEKLR